MFFDDIVDRNPDVCITTSALGRVYLRDAVLFKIDDSVFQNSREYWRGKSQMTSHEIDYARVPFQNIFMYFGGDRGYWVLGEDYEDFYGISIFAFDRLADTLTRKYSAANGEKFSNLSTRELIKHNLYFRLSAVVIEKKEQIAGIPIIAGLPIKEETNMDNPPFLKVYLACSLIIVRILTLLNCVNVKTEKHVPHPPDSRIQKARQRRGKLPLVSYHTLKINLGENLSHDASGNGDGYTNRIHLCRGHFKRYTEENPLFGKYTGLWWWQPSVRGRNREGVVCKDYELNQ